jgi:hypothetical protein
MLLTDSGAGRLPSSCLELLLLLPPRTKWSVCESFPKNIVVIHSGKGADPYCRCCERISSSTSLPPVTATAAGSMFDMSEHARVCDVCVDSRPSWTLVDPRGPSWTLVDPRGPSWTLVDPRGPSWTLVDPKPSFDF